MARWSGGLLHLLLAVAAAQAQAAQAKKTYQKPHWFHLVPLLSRSNMIKLRPDLVTFVTSLIKHDQAAT